jgi:hypothetical protein
MLAAIDARDEDRRAFEDLRQINRERQAALQDKLMTDRMRLKETFDAISDERITPAEKEKIKKGLSSAQALYDLANEIEKDPVARYKLSSFWKMNPLASQFQQNVNDYLQAYAGVAVNPTEAERTNLAFGFSNFSSAEDIATAARGIAKKISDGVLIQASLSNNAPKLYADVQNWSLNLGKQSIYEALSESKPNQTSFLTEDQKAAERERLEAERDAIEAEWSKYSSTKRRPPPDLVAKAIEMKKMLSMYGIPLKKQN